MRFCVAFHHFTIPLVSALNLLTRAGYIHFSLEDENSSRVMFLVDRDDLYHIDYLDADEERLLNVLMRTDGGFFVDYVHIEEDRLAEKCGKTPEQIYDMLRHMTQLRVINYVPHKDMPQITYTQRRIDSQYVQIMPDIYEQRRDVYKRQVDAMIGYFTQSDTCRSRYLLHYFDDDGPDCGYCDVCVAREERIDQMDEEQRVADAMEHIRCFMADNRPHTLSDFQQSGYNADTLQEALRRLMEDERIVCQGAELRWRNEK